MRKMLFILCLFSPAVGALAATEDDRKPTEEELKKLAGTWQMVSGELAGENYPEEVAKNTKLVMSGHRYVVTIGGVKDEGTTRVLPEENPKAMDITGTNGPNKGRKF